MPRRRFDHDAALAYYVGLGVERTFGKVARHFGVSDVAVGNAAKRDNWRAVAASEDRKLATKVLAKAVRSREERVLRTLKFVDGYLDEAQAKLDEGTLEIRAGEVPALVKLAELLEGEATDRIDPGQVQQVLAIVLRLAVRGLPADAFLAEFNTAVAGVLDVGGGPDREAAA